MKAIESTYGESILIVENGIKKWQKFSTKYLLEENETEEKAWERGKEKIDKWHKEKYPEMHGGKKQMPVINKEVQQKEDEEWNAVKQLLLNIKYHEDALLFLNNTPYHAMIEAKKLIKDLPLKNK